MAPPRSVRFPFPPAGLEVREAVPADNDALIALELESPLELGDIELAFDRTPDFFGRHRLHPGCRIVVGALEGRLVGVLASVIHSAPVAGTRRLLQYIHQGRVHRAVQRRGVASALSARLLLWGRERGVDSAYWLISETNIPSMSFGGRGGGLWPVPARFHDYDTRGVAAAPAMSLPPDSLSEAVELINDTHRGQELFEPFTVDSFATRLDLNPQYGRGHLRCAMEDGRVVAVAGLWDEGRTAKEIRRDRSTGDTRVTSAAAVPARGGATPSSSPLRQPERCPTQAFRCGPGNCKSSCRASSRRRRGT